MPEAEQVVIRLTSREIADLIDLDRKHTASNLTYRWNDDRTVDLIDPPEWGVQALAGMRKGTLVPSKDYDCPTCEAKAGEWCALGNKRRKNFVHDRRKILHWEAVHGKSITER
jgi:hypothetical protein